MIVNTHASQWRPDLADAPPEDDDDQDEDEDEDESDKESKSGDEGPPALDGTTEKSASRPATRENRKVSELSTSTASGFTSEKMAKHKTAAPKPAKGKRRFLSKLLCGLI